MNTYKPEGCLINTAENRLGLTLTGLSCAAENGRILEARAISCDGENNLLLDIPGIKAVIPRELASLECDVRPIAILSRVGKPVCFKVIRISREGETPVATLSRAKAQEECCNEYISKLSCGDIIDAKITHIEPFGAFADIGCGIVSLLPIDRISVSRIQSPEDRFSCGSYIKAVVFGYDRAQRRITLSMRELLGTFEENAGEFQIGHTVTGIVRSSLSYGIFIELAPNLSGLAEHRDGLSCGMAASVFIKNVTSAKMKIKLSIVDAFDLVPLKPPIKYYISEGHIDYWRYSPKDCSKLIETVFL